jgi:hypothetical protein
MHDSLTRRLGIFFLFIGLGMVMLFFASNYNLLYLLLAIASLLLGVSLYRKGPPPESTRFSGIRRLRKSSRQSNEEIKEKDTRNE